MGCIGPMGATTAATQAQPAPVEDLAEQVFEGIRAFLCAHRLSPDPLHYAFAHRVVANPDGALARSVTALTEGGVRLSAHDVEQLGGTIGALAVPDVSARAPRAAAAPAPAPASPTAGAAVDGLVAQTQMQVEGFTDMVRAIQAETQDFGRNLAASADAMRSSATTDEVMRLTGVMLGRVHSAEARLAAATREASDLRAKLEEARANARRDPLTDLPNRRAFEEAFAERTAQGDAICLAVCDVDRFKRVNDQFGHPVGDRVLKAIADALSAACADHLVARYGGEEFTVLFTGLAPADALATLESARATVAAKRYRLRESDVPLGAVTFSGGLSPAAPGEPFGLVFGRADRLLYAAKEAGRNQVLAA